MSRRFTGVCLAVVLVPGYHLQSHAGDNSGDLRSNPFAQPPPAEKVADKKQETADALELRGIMIAGSRSQANIGGEIIAIGEEIDGYRLVSVRQQHVVLIKNDVKKILAVDANERGRRK
jgi:hypothetical protein